MITAATLNVGLELSAQHSRNQEFCSAVQWERSEKRFPNSQLYNRPDRTQNSYDEKDNTKQMHLWKVKVKKHQQQTQRPKHCQLES